MEELAKYDPDHKLIQEYDKHLQVLDYEENAAFIDQYLNQPSGIDGPHDPDRPTPMIDPYLNDIFNIENDYSDDQNSQDELQISKQISKLGGRKMIGHLENSQ